MKPTTVLISVFLGILLLSPALAGQGSLERTPKPAASSAVPQGVAKNFGKLPLYFEVNQGQSDPQVRFVSRRGRFSAFLTANGAVVALERLKPSPRGDEPQARTAVFSPGRKESTTIPPSIFRMKLLGANAATEIEGLDELAGKTNFFIGNDPKKWRTNISNYARVRYQNVYSGVDLFFYGHEQQLEYDFVVAPGADPRAIQLSFDGAKSLRVDRGGNLVLNLGSEEVTFQKPMVYQPPAGANTPPGVLRGRFVIHHGNRVTFSVSDFDPRRPLIIDPALSYSTYLGGGSELGIAIAVDSEKNAYVTGTTDSIRFPLTLGAFESSNTTNGLQITYITKLNSTGTALIYSTLLGGSINNSGTLGAQSSVPGAIAVDGTGNAFVAGEAVTPDFPVTSGAWDTTFGISINFLTKLNATGSALVYSTFVPIGTNIYGLALDSSGNAYFTGLSPYKSGATPGAFQTTCAPQSQGLSISCPFVAKLNASGTAAVYITFLSGSGLVASGQELGDFAKGIAVDSSGSAYVVGGAYSTDFPVTPGAFQASQHSSGGANAFVSKLSPDGSSLVYSTYLGGSTEDFAHAIQVDSALNAYIVGTNGSTDFPVTQGAFQTQAVGQGLFVSKLNPTGTALVYSGVIPGGASGSSEELMALDSSGDVFVTGLTGNCCATLQQVNPLPPLGNGQGTFVSEINGAGSAFIFSTYIGANPGTFNESGGIAVDSAGDAYITGTADSGWPTTPGVFQSSFSGGNGFCATTCGNAFVTKITGTQVPGALLSPASLTFAPQTIGTSTSQTITLSSAGNLPLSIAAIIITGDYSQTNTCPLAPSTLTVGANCVITVTFQPRATGTLTGELTITSNGWNSPLGVTLSGASTSGIAQLSAATLTFGTQQVVTTSAAQTVTLTNVGATPLLISSIVAGGDFAQTNTCPASVPAAARCTMSVTFTPTVNGTRTGAVTITDSDPTGTQVVSLSGTGFGPVVSLAPTSLAFGNQNLNGNSPPQNVTLSNTGDGPLTLSLSVSGQFSQTNACGNSLAAGANCSISVVFAPTTAGNQTGAMTITDNASGSPHTINLSGIGIAPFVLAVASGGSATQTVAAGQTASYPLSVSPNNFTGTVTLTCSNPPPMSTCAVSTPSVNLSGTASAPVTVSVATTARSSGFFRVGGRKIFPVLAEPSWLWLLCVLTLGCVAWLAAKRAPRLRVAFCGATLSLTLIGLAACGGGSTSSIPPSTNTGTSAGTYTVTVSGNAHGTTQSIRLQVVVQ